MHYTTRIRSLREDHEYTQAYIASILHVGLMQITNLVKPEYHLNP